MEQAGGIKMCDFASVVNETPEGFAILRRALACPNKPVIAIDAQDAFKHRFLHRGLIPDLLQRANGIDVSGVGFAKIVLMDDRGRN